MCVGFAFRRGNGTTRKKIYACIRRTRITLQANSHPWQKRPCCISGMPLSSFSWRFVLTGALPFVRDASLRRALLRLASLNSFATELLSARALKKFVVPLENCVTLLLFSTLLSVIGWAGWKGSYFPSRYAPWVSTRYRARGSIWDLTLSAVKRYFRDADGRIAVISFGFIYLTCNRKTCQKRDVLGYYLSPRKLLFTYHHVSSLSYFAIITPVDRE